MRPAMRCVACVAVVAWCWLGSVLAFNLEPRIPVVKIGSPKSHFGYTVAQHQSILETSSGGTQPKSWILVGAPKDHNLQPGTNRSGALWKCPLTTNTTDCTQVHTDGYRNLDGTLSEPAEDEIKDGQWLGATLKSQGPGGKVLVCAHRYINKGNDFQWGFGLCYILTSELDVSDKLEPCRGKPVDREHQQYGYCQAGTSGFLPLDDEAVLGVPGTYTWRGTVHASNISDNFLHKDKTKYFGPVMEDNSPVDKYSYLGYSVTAGRFFGNYMSYVGGAPRSQGTGQVVFFSKQKIGNSLLRVDLILSGETDMFAASFGYEVLALDINGDSYDDLVVGAPFYHTRKASGAIYVYMNTEQGFKEDHPYNRIEGAPGESRFGSSMTSLGDLNHDEFLDVAVGAPYEGRGAVYIFLGGSEGLSSKPSQVIRAEDMPGPPYNAFGYSLSGGMDLDGNGYPDLLTSSFCSDRVVLLRARPIIDIETEVRSRGQLTNIDPSRKGCRDDIQSPRTCFSFDACFKMDNKARTRTDLKLHYTIEERPYQDRPLARVEFADSLPNEPSEVHRNITLRPGDLGVFRCSRETVYLLEGAHDILRPLRFKLSYVIIQKEPRPVIEGQRMPDINEYPILNQKGALREFEGTFAKDCGDDDVCMSDLHMTGWLELERHETRKHYLMQLGHKNMVPLVVEVKNSEEPAYETTLIINHNEGLIFDPLESEIGINQCSSPSTGVVKCSVGNPLTNTTGPLKFIFKESGKDFDSKFIYFSVQVNSSSNERTPQEPLHFEVEVIKKAEISIIGNAAPEQVFYGGEVVGESAIKHFDEIGMEVTHKYLVRNEGPWRVDELQVEVLWPYQVENGREKGKWLLYMTEHPTVDGIGECEIDPKYVNPLNLRRSKILPDPSTGHRVDLEVESTDPEPEVTTGTGGGVVTGSTTKVTKTTTITKKTTTVKKSSTKKTSSEKESSVTSGGSGGSSSSSSTSYSSSSSSSSSSHSGSYGHDDTLEGSGYGGRDGQVQGRTHSRVSRRVFTSSDRSRYDDNALGGETTKDDTDEEGRVITDYERTYHSSGSSPDGKSTFQETRHESKKVTVSENSNTENIPSGKWGQRGGYKRTRTESHSSSRTSAGEPEETYTHWETHQTQPREQDNDNQWSDSGSSNVYERREESRREHSRTQTSDFSTERTEHSQFGEDGFSRTHEGGAVTQTFGHDGSYYTGGNRRTQAQGQGSRDDRERFVWSDQTGRSYDRETGSRNRERKYYEDRTHRTDDYASERTGNNQRQDLDGDGHERRVSSSSQWSYSSQYDDRSNNNQRYDHDRRTGDHRDSEGGNEDRSSSGQGYRDRYDDRSHYGNENSGTHSSSYDRTRGRDSYDRRESEYSSRRQEGDGWQGTNQGRPQYDTYGRGGAYQGSHDDREHSYSSSTGHRSYTESRTSSRHSNSRDSERDRSHRQGLDDNYKSHSGGSSERHFTHIDSDGSLTNGTYTRVEVDPKTGETRTYTRKVVYDKWPSDGDRQWDTRDSTFWRREEQESSNNQRSARTKREQELIIKPQAITDEETGKTMQIVSLRCDGPATAKCFAFRCNIRRLAADRSATIQIKSRLWNATLVEDYPRVSSVHIASKGTLILPENIRKDQDQSDDTASAETQAYPDLLDQLPPEEVPLWVILVSIFAGILVLIIIVLILWKLGFFERRRPDPTLSGNLNRDANGY